MSNADFFDLPLFVRREIIALARRDPKRHELTITERLGRAYRALVSCA